MILILFQVIIIVGARRPRQKPILSVKLSTTSPEKIKNISQSRRKKTVESDVSLNPPPTLTAKEAWTGTAKEEEEFLLNEKKFENLIIQQ